MKNYLLFIAIVTLLCSCKKEIPYGKNYCQRCDGTGIELSNFPNFRCSVCYGDGYERTYNSRPFDYPSGGYDDDGYGSGEVSFQGRDVQPKYPTVRANISITVRNEFGTTKDLDVYKFRGGYYVKMGNGKSQDMNNWVNMIPGKGQHFTWNATQWTVQ